MADENGKQDEDFLVQVGWVTHRATGKKFPLMADPDTGKIKKFPRAPSVRRKKSEKVT